PRRRLALDRLNAQPMIRMLKRVQPDLCVATHFLPAEILAWLIAKKKLQAKNAIVVTDYDVHAMWLCRTVCRYYVAIPEATEDLARHLPMALIEPIPGQEFRNADHLLENGAAIRCNNLPAAAWKIASLLDDPARLARLRDSAARMARPNAAADIAEDALRLLH